MSDAATPDMPVAERVEVDLGPRRDGITIVADTWEGDRPPIVLAHGGGQTRHSWGATAARLAASGHEVWSIDLRGHGDSAWVADGDYTTAAFRDDALALVERIGRPVAWVGASLGGSTGLSAVHVRPEAFWALVLVDITPHPARAGVDRILTFMAETSARGFADLDEAADAVAAYQPHRKRPKDSSGLAKNLRLHDDGRWRWHWDPQFVSGGRAVSADAGRHDEMERAARALRLPTLLVRGRLSDLVTQEQVDGFLEMVPHAEYVDVAGAAHMIAGDRNDAFGGAVEEFLARANPEVSR